MTPERPFLLPFNHWSPKSRDFQIAYISFASFCILFKWYEWNHHVYSSGFLIHIVTCSLYIVHSHSFIEWGHCDLFILSLVVNIWVLLLVWGYYSQHSYVFWLTHVCISVRNIEITPAAYETSSCSTSSPTLIFHLFWKTIVTSHCPYNSSHWPWNQISLHNLHNSVIWPLPPQFICIYMHPLISHLLYVDLLPKQYLPFSCYPWALHTTNSLLSFLGLAPSPSNSNSVVSSPGQILLSYAVEASQLQFKRLALFDFLDSPVWAPPVQKSVFLLIIAPVGAGTELELIYLNEQMGHWCSTFASPVFMVGWILHLICIGRNCQV